MHLIGIELIDCKNDIYKNLKVKNQKLEDGSISNGWYPFCEYKYKNESLNVDNDNPPIRYDIPIKFDIPNNLYKCSDKDMNISISCIVGKNGSGKSTLLDILYRIINNFSFYFLQLSNFTKNQLIYSFGFTAVLYFSLSNSKNEEEIGYIKINDENNCFVKFPEQRELRLGKVEKKGKKYIIDNSEVKSINQLESFFYSIVTNYSMYAFNPEDYCSNDYYVRNIFHKNDAYTTPIVLLPYRDKKGAIDIENERDLARQRIIALQIYLYNHNKKHFEFINSHTPSKISYTFISSYKDDRNSDEEINELVTAFLYTAKTTSSLTTRTFFDNLQNLWINFFEEYLSIKIEKKIKNEKIRENLIFYLAYKTLKLCSYYGVFLKNFDSNKENESLTNIIHQIYENKTFITLKVRQCVNFICYPLPINKNIKLENRYEISNILVNNKNANVDDYLIQLPPAIFKTDLLFKSDANEYYMSSLSSGQLQLLSTLSYVLYHLKNLECEKADLEKKSNSAFPNYKNISIVFDEAELYLHPEFQRHFIKKLIEAINNCHFENIKNVHILIATHSPYILSDVPNNSILMLDDGKIQKTKEQTFAANIYDLLKNQFFMDAPIGEIAKQKINDIIKVTNSRKKLQEEQISEYEYFVKQIGDSYLKKTLLYLLNKKRKEIK